MRFNLTQFVTEKRSVESVLDFLPYPFLVSELKDDIYHNVYVNKKFTEEIGYACDEMPTINEWFDLAYPDPKYRREVINGWTERYLASKNANEDSVVMRVLIHTRFNDDLWYEVKSSLFENVQLVAFVNIHEEVTRGEALRRLNDNRSKTMAILTTDIRTPLNNLNFLSQRLLNEHVDQKEFSGITKEMSEKSFKVLEFVDTVLQWSKSNSDTIEVADEAVDLRKMIEDIVSMYDPALKLKSITVAYDCRGGTLNTDPSILAIVIRNLISNAINFSLRNGSIFVEADTSGLNKFITIRDSGAGMSREHISFVFSDQYPALNGREVENSQGVELKLCIELLRTIGAKLSIESAPQKGTIARIDFYTEASK
jgi:two-component system sensor histidine kinase/response regulator